MPNDPNVFRQRTGRGGPDQPSPGKIAAAVAAAAVLLIVAWVGFKSYKSVPAGHVAVATLFGDAVDDEFDAGLHFPVNPLYEWVEYDIREKTYKESANVPSQDQLQTEIDVSVQFNVLADQASRILRETGTFEDVVEVHLTPKLRSLLREQGKTVTRAEDFFQPTTQERLTTDIESKLRAYLEPKGVNVQAVLLRDFNLPASILANVELKKQAEQRVEQEKAELEQVRVQSQQQVAQAEAKRQAAEQEAEQRKLLAEAQAYEIEQINTAIADNPAYIQLESLKALQAISDSPSSKLYFLNGDSPQPLPLMNIGGGTNPLTRAGDE